MTGPGSRFDLDALEFHVVRELLVERLSTPLGRVAALALAPLSDPAAATAAAAAADALARKLAAGQQPPLAGVVEVRSWLPAFFAGEHAAETRDLADLGRLLRATVRCRSWLEEAGDPALASLGNALPDVADLSSELDSIVDVRGEILSTASARLAEIRREIETAEQGVRAAVARFVADERVRRYLQSPEPSWRHGRPVFQVKAEHRRAIEGVLHDRSQSGATLFVEPSSVVDAANQLSDARAAEHREIQVVIAHACRGLRRSQADVEQAVAGLTQLDLGIARARLIQVDGFRAVPIRPGQPLRLRRALHPILLRRARTARDGTPDPVPLDLALDEPFRLLVVTGPNTGGKTVVLKTVGLLALMAQAGVPVPADEGTQLPWFDGVFADIGDEQAITQNLSTFSSHVTRIVRCLQQATAESLVLIDELGAGTDPEEGAALGYAVLEELHRRRVFSVVTTHLGRLKEFAHDHTGAENASLAFDGVTLAPLYRLEVGLPGASHALDIASRVGMPAPVVRRARELLGRRDRRLEEIVEQAQQARRDAELRRQETVAESVRVRETRDELDRQRQEVERRGNWLQEEADAVVAAELRRLREALAPGLSRLAQAPRPHGELAQQLAAALADLGRGTSVHRRRMQFLASLGRDDLVYVPRLARRCQVRKLDRVREVLTVQVGKLAIEIPFEEVSWLAPLSEDPA